MAVLNRAALAVPGGGTMVMARFDREWILQGTMAASETRATIPLLLSLNAGYVDTAGFLALQGLFAAHVTGNFVTLGASLALGTSGAIAKLLALPVFCAVVIVSRLLGTVLSNRIGIVFEVLLGLKVLLLIGGAALAIKWSPIHDGDSWHAILTGMILVAAMADADDDDDHRHQWSAQAIENILGESGGQQNGVSETSHYRRSGGLAVRPLMADFVAIAELISWVMPNLPVQ